MRYRTVLAAYRGDPGFFGSIGRALGSVAGTVVRNLPIPGAGIVGGVVSSAFGGAPRVPGIPTAGPGGLVPQPGVGGAISRFLPGGSSGFTTRACLTKAGKMRKVRRDGKCYKRPTMNPMNPRAARRAIVRIKSARRLLHSIEMALPKRHASRKAGGRKCGCR